MKRILFLAYYFPPAPASGAVRARHLASNLTKLGWHITVLTPAASLWRNPDDAMARGINKSLDIVETKHYARILSPAYFKCGATWYHRIVGGVLRRSMNLMGIEREIGWLLPLLYSTHALEGNNFDLILATGSPFLAFEIAARLGRKWKIPYVLDYRDPWTVDVHSGRTASAHKIARERSLLSGAAAVSVVTRTWAEHIAGGDGNSQKATVVPNGFDIEESQSVDPMRWDHFSIVYAGTFYPPKRVIDPIFLALQKLYIRRPELQRTCRFHYFGFEGEYILSRATAFGLPKDTVVVHGVVPRHVAMSAQKGANIVVVITSISETSSGNEGGIITGKVFEPLGFGVPVLLITPEGSEARSLLESTTAVKAFNGTQANEISYFFESETSQPCRTREIPRELAWSAQAKKMNDLLINVLERNGDAKPAKK